MRTVLGLVSLLIVLAVIGVLAMKQLKSVNSSVGASLPPVQTGTDTAVAMPAASNVRDQSRQLQQRMASDVSKAIEQGAQRNQDADK